MSRCRICDKVMTYQELSQEEDDVCFDCKDKDNYLWELDGLKESEDDDLDVDIDE